MIKRIIRKQKFNCVDISADNELFNYCWDISKKNDTIKNATLSNISKELMQLALFVVILKNFHDKDTIIKYKDEKFKQFVKMLNNTIFN